MIMFQWLYKVAVLPLKLIILLRIRALWSSGLKHVALLLDAVLVPSLLEGEFSTMCGTGANPVSGGISVTTDLAVIPVYKDNGGWGTRPADQS